MFWLLAQTAPAPTFDLNSIFSNLFSGNGMIMMLMVFLFFKDQIFGWFTKKPPVTTVPLPTPVPTPVPVPVPVPTPTPDRPIVDTITTQILPALLPLLLPILQTLLKDLVKDQMAHERELLAAAESGSVPK